MFVRRRRRRRAIVEQIVRPRAMLCRSLGWLAGRHCRWTVAHPQCVHSLYGMNVSLVREAASAPPIPHIEITIDINGLARRLTISRYGAGSRAVCTPTDRPIDRANTPPHMNVGKYHCYICGIVWMSFSAVRTATKPQRQLRIISSMVRGANGSVYGCDCLLWICQQSYRITDGGGDRLGIYECTHGRSSKVQTNANTCANGNCCCERRWIRVLMNDIGNGNRVRRTCSNLYAQHRHTHTLELMVCIGCYHIP